MANFFDATYYSLCGFTLAPNRLSKWKSWIYVSPPHLLTECQFQVLPKCLLVQNQMKWVNEYHYHEWPTYFNNQGIYLFQLLNLWHALLTLGSNNL
jgi:hypothetical protein